MKKRIHVNMHHIRHNKKHGTNKPVITVKTSKSNNYAHGVEILGKSKLIYSPIIRIGSENHPIPCAISLERKTLPSVEKLKKVILKSV